MNISKHLSQKALLKQDIFDLCQTQFKSLVSILEELVVELQKEHSAQDKRLEIKLEQVHDYECRLFFGGDVLTFTMHTNIFQFPKEHSIHEKDYIQEDPTRSFCCSLYIHNFLADSFRFQRYRDPGLLIGRVFINKDAHFFVEGQRQLGFLFNAIEQMKISPTYWRDIIISAIVFAIDHDLQVPNYQNVQLISLGEKIQQSGLAISSTSKPLGFVYEGKETE